jgi:hypothetical protein
MTSIRRGKPGGDTSVQVRQDEAGKQQMQRIMMHGEGREGASEAGHIRRESS